METSKLDVIIPLAIAAAAGFLFARATRRKDNLVMLQGDHDIQSVDSSYLSCSESSPETYNHELEEENSVLRSSVKEMEIRYLRYHDSKGQELMVMELEKMILVEITRAQIMEMDASSETEKQRFQNMFLEYQKTLGLFQLSRSRNRMLRRRMNKVLRKTKEQRELIKELHNQIEAAKAESSRTHEESGDKTEIIRKMDDEIQELKNALSAQMIEMADMTASSKMNAEEMAAATEELKQLRWSNACLRDELTRKNQEEEHNPRKEEGLKFAEIGYFGSDDDELGGHSGCLNLPATAISHGGAAHHSRRKKLIRRLKRWVEGSDHKEKHGYGGGDEMHVIQGRKSCSSV